MVIPNRVTTKELEFWEQEPQAIVAFSRYRNSFIIVGYRAPIEELRFQEWKGKKKTSDGVLYDNLKL